MFYILVLGGGLKLRRIIFHVDVNNAFLSWTAVELLKQGYGVDIRNIPSVIGGDEAQRRGIVLAKSPVAKSMGVVTAEALFQARRKCPGLKVFPANYSLYKQESDKLFEYFCTLTPIVERYSIDECFLDFTGTSYLYDDYLLLARKMQKYINDNFGITVNIGIAENRLCAKMASDFLKPNKIHTLFPSEIKSKMWPLKVDDLFMVGRKSAVILHQLGIHTIGDLARTDVVLLSKYFKNQAIKMIESANGIDESLVCFRESKEKSISVSETLPEDVVDTSKLKEVLLFQADKVARSARRENLYAGVVSIILKNNQFVNYSHQKKLVNPTNATEEVYKISCELLKNIWKGEPIRLIGIRLSDFTTNNQKQVSLFESESERNVDKLQSVIDGINDKYGNMKVMPASMKNKKK